MTCGLPEYTDNEDFKLSWESGQWLSFSGKTLSFFTQNYSLDFSVTSTLTICSSFQRGHNTLKVIDLYSSIHFNSLPQLGQEFISCPWVEIKTSCLGYWDQNSLSLPRKLQHLSPHNLIFSFHCGHVHFSLPLVFSIFFPCTTDTQIKQNPYFLSHPPHWLYTVYFYLCICVFVCLFIYSLINKHTWMCQPGYKQSCACLLKHTCQKFLGIGLLGWGIYECSIVCNTKPFSKVKVIYEIVSIHIKFYLLYYPNLKFLPLKMCIKWYVSLCWFAFPWLQINLNVFYICFIYVSVWNIYSYMYIHKYFVSHLSASFKCIFIVFCSFFQLYFPLP